MTSSPHITAEGRSALETELKGLWERRAGVTAALAAAAAEGDRSENAEYTYRKKELREIDRRIRFLQKRLPLLKVVSEVADRTRVYFGAWVTLENEAGVQLSYRIVGSDEFHRDPACVSVDSPLARALMGKSTGDKVIVELAAGRRTYTIIEIRYP